jgi:hypothetical protein
MLDFFGAAVESDLPDEWKPRVTWLIDRCRKLEKVAEAAKNYCDEYFEVDDIVDLVATRNETVLALEKLDGDE